jgi:hypothetical protein
MRYNNTSEIMNPRESTFNPACQYSCNSMPSNGWVNEDWRETVSLRLGGFRVEVRACHSAADTIPAQNSATSTCKTALRNTQTESYNRVITHIAGYEIFRRIPRPVSWLIQGARPVTGSNQQILAVMRETDIRTLYCMIYVCISPYIIINYVKIV